MNGLSRLFALGMIGSIGISIWHGKIAAQGAFESESIQGAKVMTFRSAKGATDNVFVVLDGDSTAVVREPDLKAVFSNNGISSLQISRMGKASSAEILRVLPGAAKIEKMEWITCDLDSETNTAFARCRFVTQFKLRDCRVSNQFLEGIAKLTLKSLTITNCNWDATVLVAICGAQPLEYLDLSTCSQLDVTLFSKIRISPNLKSLRLDKTKVGDENIMAIGNLPALEALDLGFTNVRDEGLLQLGSNTKLKSLWLPGARVTNEGARHLGKLSGLVELNISETNIDANGLLFLKDLKKMRTLQMTCKLTDEAMEPVWGLRDLTKLSLDASGVSDATIPRFQQMRSLKQVTLHNHNNIRADIKSFRAMCPGVNIVAGR